MRKNQFWLGLVGLCAAAACALAIALALVSATTALAFASHPDPEPVEANQDTASQQKIFTGVITDTSCGARHMEADKNAAQCTRECVRKGASYALVAGDRVYRLEGDTAEIDKHAGQRAQIRGLLEGNVVTVTGVGPAQ
jgi:hypothetical protein